jgi:hypothetical protein
MNNIRLKINKDKSLSIRLVENKKSIELFRFKENEKVPEGLVEGLRIEYNSLY